MQLEIWTDFACPYCYIGERLLQAALDRFEYRDEVSVSLRSFELHPGAPTSMSEDVYTTFAKEIGKPIDEARETLGKIKRLAQTAGLEYDIDRMQMVNTRDAHRLAVLADRTGLRPALSERLFAAYFCEGRNIADTATLRETALATGLDAEQTDRVLADKTLFDSAVQSEHNAAVAMNIDYVPYFLVNNKDAISGVVTEQKLLDFLIHTREHLNDTTSTTIEGAACGIHGCN